MEECYGTSFGIKASQLISRKSSDSLTRTSQNITDNIHNFLVAHSGRNCIQKWKKRTSSEFLARDIQLKSSSVHKFLCGPLNTNRLTRKSNSSNYGNFSHSGFRHLYSTNELVKPPWDEAKRDNCMNNSSTTLNLFKNGEHCGSDLQESIRECVTPKSPAPDSFVPDPMNIDEHDSCPLYDSSEYEQLETTNETSKHEQNRYGFFDGKDLSKYFVDEDGLNECFRSEKIKSTGIRRSEQKNREQIFIPLVTSFNGQQLIISELRAEQF